MYVMDLLRSSGIDKAAGTLYDVFKRLKRMARLGPWKRVGGTENGSLSAQQAQQADPENIQPVERLDLAGMRRKACQLGQRDRIFHTPMQMWGATAEAESSVRVARELRKRGVRLPSG